MGASLRTYKHSPCAEDWTNTNLLSPQGVYEEFWSEKAAAAAAWLDPTATPTSLAASTSRSLIPSPQYMHVSPGPCSKYAHVTQLMIRRFHHVIKWTSAPAPAGISFWLKSDLQPECKLSHSQELAVLETHV